VHNRVPYGAWLEDVSESGQIKFYLTKNLSRGGLLLEAKSPPPIGRHVRLRLVVENEKKTITFTGRVVRHDVTDSGEQLFAVQFGELDEEVTRFLDELVTELSRSES
jgi:c-di-GMP-binding flagellar brake protein YcgR